MKQRCLNPNHPRFHDYGGRGITIAKLWLGRKGFEKFFAHVGIRPHGKTLDRINNDRGYTPDNVRWATPRQQSRNARNVRQLTINGETRPLVEWAARFRKSPSTIRARLRLGWSVEAAVRKHRYERPND